MAAADFQGTTMGLGTPWLYPDEHGNWPDREIVFTIEFPDDDPVDSDIPTRGGAVR